jgi:hypothetical protein
MLDTWDTAIVERFDAMQSSRSSERVACALRISTECLGYLDRTLHELRKRAQHRGSEALANESELMALRSAAVDVATTAYTDGLRKRRTRASTSDRGDRFRQPPRRATSDLTHALDLRQGVSLESVVCMLPPSLLGELDAELRESRHTESLERSRRRPADDLPVEDMRSLVVESSLVAWLILRGYSTAVSKGKSFRGWSSAVRYLARLRRRRGR